jgi:recombination protein RecA
MRLGDGAVTQVPVISTGALSLDIALGINGVPRGRIIEIYGPESSGKTTVCLHIIANAQRAGGLAAFIDSEHAFDPTYAKLIGVNTRDLLVSQPDCGEDALNIAETLVRSNAIDVLVVDSVAALVPRAEIEGQMGDSHVGLQARLMSQALRKITGAVSRSKTCLIFTNQMREKIGVMFGNPETTPGGNALKFYSSIRMDIRRIEAIKAAAGDQIGNRVRVKVVKNKMAPPFRIAHFDIMFAEGISRAGSILDTALDMGIVAKRGSWLSFDDEHLGQGREQAKETIKVSEELQTKLITRIRDQIAAGKAAAAAAPVTEEAPATATEEAPVATDSEA